MTNVEKYCHQFHCDDCFDASCKIRECLIVSCQFCRLNLHKCKLEEHQELICYESRVPCLLSQYGCPATVLRRRISDHLKYCPAYVIICKRRWSRRFLSLEAKHLFKQIQKNFLPNPVYRTTDESDPEISLALLDQKVVATSFQSTRDSRIKQRDASNKYHPLLPLKYYIKEENPFEGDSSDEEERIMKTKLRAKQKIFAGCIQCLIDPSVQHLHTLGNLSEELKNKHREFKKDRELTIHGIMPHYHLRHGIFLTTETGIRLTDNVKLVYTFCCEHNLRREEYVDHLAYHNELAHIEGGPSWWCTYGCGFRVNKEILEEGFLRYEPYLGTVLYSTPTVPESSVPIDEFTKVIASTIPYLDSAQLNALSSTCRSLRRLIFSQARHKSVMYPIWEKTEERKWAITEYKMNFSKVQKKTWILKKNGEIFLEMERHWKECPLKKEIKLSGKEKIALAGMIKNSDLPKGH